MKSKPHAAQKPGRQSQRIKHRKPSGQFKPPPSSSNVNPDGVPNSAYAIIDDTGNDGSADQPDPLEPSYG